MANTTINFKVSNVRNRYRAQATIDGALMVFPVKRMADLDEAIVEAALSEGVERVNVYADADESIVPAVAKVSESRSSLVAALSARNDAVKEAMDTLHDAGLSVDDAARTLGITPAMAKSILEGYKTQKNSEDGAGDSVDGTDSVSTPRRYGSSLLGEEPTEIENGQILLGSWVRDGDYLVSEGIVTVASLDSRVRSNWIRTNDLQAPSATEQEVEADADADTDSFADKSEEIAGQEPDSDFSDAQAPEEESKAFEESEDEDNQGWDDDTE